MLMHGNNYGQIQFDAPHQHVRLQKSVRLSVRLSLCGIVSKRKLMHVSSNCFITW